MLSRGALHAASAPLARLRPATVPQLAAAALRAVGATARGARAPQEAPRRPFRAVFGPFSGRFRPGFGLRFSFRRREKAPVKEESKGYVPLATDALADFKGERLSGLREQLILREPGELEAGGCSDGFSVAFYDALGPCYALLMALLAMVMALEGIPPLNSRPVAQFCRVATSGSATWKTAAWCYWTGWEPCTCTSCGAVRWWWPRWLPQPCCTTAAAASSPWRRLVAALAPIL